jgi:hypothetical protein
MAEQVSRGGQVFALLPCSLRSIWFGDETTAGTS